MPSFSCSILPMSSLSRADSAGGLLPGVGVVTLAVGDVDWDLERMAASASFEAFIAAASPLAALPGDALIAAARSASKSSSSGLNGFGVRYEPFGDPSFSFTPVLPAGEVRLCVTGSYT